MNTYYIDFYHTSKEIFVSFVPCRQYFYRKSRYALFIANKLPLSIMMEASVIVKHHNGEFIRIKDRRGITDVCSSDFEWMFQCERMIPTTIEL